MVALGPLVSTIALRVCQMKANPVPLGWFVSFAKIKIKTASFAKIEDYLKMNFRAKSSSIGVVWRNINLAGGYRVGPGGW